MRLILIGLLAGFISSVTVKLVEIDQCSEVIK